jgi:hypothetical protein
LDEQQTAVYSKYLKTEFAPHRKLILFDYNDRSVNAVWINNRSLFLKLYKIYKIILFGKSLKFLDFEAGGTYSNHSGLKSYSDAKLLMLLV